MLTDEIVEKYNIDKKKISITGISMGGFGTWSVISQYNDYFSCAAPICGGGLEWRSDRLVNMKIWAFHGELDNLVPVSHTKNMVEAINSKGGNAKMTIYPNVYHDSWVKAYEESDLIDWLLKNEK